MLVKQSLAVNTAVFKDEGFSSIAHDVTLLKTYLRANPRAFYATPQLIDQEDPKSIIVLRMRQKKKEILMTLINPMILEYQGSVPVEEEQDQIEGTYLNIRHSAVHIAYVALPSGTAVETTLTGKSAFIFQQALRLTQGISIDVFGLRVDDYEEYQKGDDEAKANIVADYIKALKEISEESLQDEDTQEYIKATDFLSENARNSITDEVEESAHNARAEAVAAIKPIVEAEAAKRAKEKKGSDTD